jgi:hypothetical protein
MPKHLSAFFIFAWLVLLTNVVKAETFSPKWSVSGFGSLGGIGTDTNAIKFYRDTTQTKGVGKSWTVTTDSRFGLQLDIALNEQFHITTQYIIRDHAGDFFEQNLEWAFLRWSPSSDVDIRVGRLGIDSFLLSDYRDVGYAYPWMRPPHEFYAHILGSHFDGFDISKHYRLGNNFIKLKLFAGYSHGNLRQSSKIIEAPIAGANIGYNTGNWRTKIGYTYLQLLNEALNDNIIKLINDPRLNIILPGFSNIAPRFSNVNTYGHFLSVGSTYDNGLWQIQTEAAYTNTNSLYFTSRASAYLSIGRRFANITLYTLYGISHSFQNPLDIPKPTLLIPLFQEVYNQLDTLANKNGQDEQSLSLGLRWDFYTNIAFKVQWSHYWIGAPNNTQQWEKVPPQSAPHNINVWSVGIDFIF